MNELSCDEIIETISPAVPFRWANVPVESRPPSPEYEYLHSPFSLSGDALKRRWAGLPEAEMVDMVFANNYLPLERARVQFLKLKGAEVPDYTDPQYKRNQNALDIMTAQAEIDRIKGILETGLEPVREKVFDKELGRFVEEEFRPVSSKGMRDYQASLVELIKLRRILEGEASEIVRVQDSSSDLLTMMRERMAETDESYRKLTAVRDNALPEGSEEGELIDVTAEVVLVGHANDP